MEDVEYRLKADDTGRYYLLDPEKELVYVFRPDRLLERIMDRKGNAHSLFYDLSGNLDRVEDGLGRIVSFTYEEFEAQRFRLSGIHDAGRSYVFSYAGHLLSAITDPMGHTIRFEYDPDGNGLITRIVYPNGNTPYSQAYDGQGRVASQTDALGNATTLSLPVAEEDPTVITYPGGGAVEHTHAGREKLTESLDPAGGSVSVDYDASGRRTAVTDRLGDTVSMSYHPESGNPSSKTDALGQTTRYTYAPVEQTFELVSFTFYDVTRITYPDGCSDEFTYDGRGNVSERKDRVGKIWRHTYNAAGQLLTLANPSGGLIEYTFTRVTDALGHATDYTYDPMGRLVEATDS